MFKISREKKRQILIKIAPPLMYMALRIIYVFTRHRFHINEYARFYIVQSHHFDAELMVRVIALFHLKSLRGSSSKGGLRVLMEALKLLREGYDIGLSLDGPKGPYHTISDGIVAMSQKTERHIIPIRVVYSRYWELKTWDKFRIPKPFSRIDYYMLDGFVIDKDMNLDEAKTLICTHLEKEL